MAKKTKNKSGARFNIFDVLIILALLACVGAIVVRVVFISNVEDVKKNVTIVYKIENISEETAIELCKPNQTVYLQKNNDNVGILESATYTEQIVWMENEAGELVKALHPDKKQITEGKASISGTWKDGDFLIGGTYLATVGDTIDIYTQNVACTITIVSISKNA